MNMRLNASPQQLLTDRLQTALEATPHISAVPQSAHIGALIGGVDLSQPLSAAEIHSIRSALLRWKVVFFREQHLSHAQHVAFAPTAMAASPSAAPGPAGMRT